MIDEDLTHDLVEAVCLAASGNPEAVRAIDAERIASMCDRQAVALLCFFNGFAAGLKACEHPSGAALHEAVWQDGEGAHQPREAVAAALAALQSGDAR